MAAFTLGARVRAEQRKIRLVMVEPDIGPDIHRVAGRAVRTVPALMDVVIPVAIDTCRAELHPTRRALRVTGLALDLRVATAQAETGNVMIEPDFSPARRLMAALTIGPEPAFMNVVSIVTAHAIDGELPPDLVLMTTHALGFGVLPQQWEICCIVVETDEGPVLGIVAVGASFSKL